RPLIPSPLDRRTPARLTRWNGTVTTPQRRAPYGSARTRRTASNTEGPVRGEPSPSRRRRVGRGPRQAGTRPRGAGVAPCDGSDRRRARRDRPGRRGRALHVLRLRPGEPERAPERLLRPRGAGVTEGAPAEEQRGRDGCGDGRRAPDGGRVPSAAGARRVRHEDVELDRDPARRPLPRRGALLRPPLRQGVRLPQRRAVVLRGAGFPRAAPRVSPPAQAGERAFAAVDPFARRRYHRRSFRLPSPR